MKEIDLGMIGFILGGVSFCLGRIAGRKATAPCAQAATPCTEVNSLEEEQRAFRALTGYSADIAYGSVPFFPEADA